MDAYVGFPCNLLRMSARRGQGGGGYALLGNVGTSNIVGQLARRVYQSRVGVVGTEADDQYRTGVDLLDPD